MPARLPFQAVMAVDFEYDFGGDNFANLPRPVCMSYRDLRTGRGGNVWLEGAHAAAPPFSTGTDTLFVAYNATAEIGCFRTLGWPIPERVLDLYPEFANLMNGVHAGRKGLVHAMEYFGLDTIGVVEKKAMVDLILRGPPWTDEEKQQIVEYCNSDVDALARLLPAMIPFIDLPRALFRGRYMANLAAVQNAGAPIDLPTYRLFVKHWDGIKERLIAEIDEDFGVYEGTSFREERFEALLIRLGIPWPLLDSGRPALDKDTFKEMARAYPIISPIRELRHALTDMRLPELAVSDDGWNRTALFPFASRTGRNQPGSNKFIFGLSVYLRGLNQAAARPRGRLHGLAEPRGRHRRRPVWRRTDDVRLSKRRPIHHLRHRGRHPPARRHQGHPQGRPRHDQGLRPRRPIRDGREDAGH